MSDFYSQFRDTDYALVNLEDQQSRLPIGVHTTEGKVLRDIVFRTLSREDLKKIWDKKFSQNHPIQWIARIISLVVESIGGEPVYAPYHANGQREYPDIVREIPMADTSYIMFMGHIFNYGWSIEKVRTQCLDATCERKQVIPSVNLKRMVVEYTEDIVRSFDVYLQEGLAVPDPDNQSKVIPHTHLKIRVPVVGDALKYEQFYRLNDQGDFYERVYSDCLEEVSTSTGESLDESRIKGLGAGLLKKMSAQDSATLEGTFNKVPALMVIIQETCGYCSEDLPVFIQQSFLFPRRR